MELSGITYKVLLVLILFFSQAYRQTKWTEIRFNTQNIIEGNLWSFEKIKIAVIVKTIRKEKQEIKFNH